MEEPGNSRWALVIRDDGEASVVPLANVSVLHQDGADGDEKNPTVIVLQTNEQGDITHESHVGLNITDEIGVTSSSNTDGINPFISLSSSQVEDSSDLGGAVITIGEDGQQEPSGDVETIENIQISVLAPSDTPDTEENTKVLRDIVHSRREEPFHIVRAHTEHSKAVQQKPFTKCISGKNIVVKPLVERSTNDKKLEKDGETQLVAGEIMNTNILNAEEKESVEENERQKKEEYILSLNAWTKRLPSLGSGGIEPFKKVEATLHKDLSTELGIESDRGIFFSLHQQGVARGVRVVETGPEQVVVSGSLVELLASRDMILSEIEKIRGTSSEASLSSVNKTCEVGVMCELIPSPPSARYASSTGLDRSARRYHSVLSRPISPEPRPQRKRSRKHIVSEAKFKNVEKMDVSGSPTRQQKRRSESRTMRTMKIKVEKDLEERQTERDALRSKESDPSVEILLGDLKMEPECDETIIVSNISNPDLDQETQELEEIICKTKTVAVNKDCKTDIVPSLSKEVGLRTVEERGQGLRRCLEVESSNKENIEIDNPQFLYKPKEQVADEEGIDLDVEDSKIICEPEINMSEGQDDELSKVHSVEEVKFKFSCQICSYKSMRENHFVKHMKLHDKGLALYKCNECNFVSIRASHLRRHKMSHAQQVLNCHLCSYTCDDQKLLTKHVRVKHQTPKPKQITSEVEPQVVFECDECDYKTSWHYAYQRHRRTHSSSKIVRIHTCPQCPYKTMRREHFLRHIKNVHQNHRPFLCDICGKAFKRQDALKQHHVTHYQNMGEGSSGQMGPYGFVCHICQKVCRSAAYLKEHMATHSEERSFLCEVCGASFKTRSVQRNHVQTIHRRPRSFTCLTCEKKFNTKYALRRHMKQHDTSLEDGEILPDVSSETRLCDLQPRASSSISRSRSSLSTNPPLSPASAHPAPVPPDVGATSRMLIPSAAPPPAAPAYHFTIGGQPAFILPHIDGQHAAIEEGDPSVIEEGSTVIMSGDSTNTTDLRALAGQSAASTALSVPVVPTAVHIVNQDQLTTQPGDIILSSDHYQPNRAPAVVTSDTANYVAQEHGSSTLLYLTGNFN